jgi:hypothetical protein
VTTPHVGRGGKVACAPTAAPVEKKKNALPLVQR